MVKEINPDLILMDIKMPVLNGLEATKILKKDKNYSNIPIIALTASIRVKEVHSLTTLFNGYITKPIIYDILIKELIRFLPYKTNVIELENYSNAQVLKIDEDKKDIFIEQFEINIKNSWQKASQGCSTEDIIEFSNALSDFAKIYEQNSLVVFSDAINIAIYDFDITSLENLIEEFSAFLKEIDYD